LPNKDKTTSVKESLETLNISQLKSLAKEHNIKVKGKVEKTLKDHVIPFGAFYGVGLRGRESLTPSG
jgi:hypothetical protein